MQADLSGGSEFPFFQFPSALGPGGQQRKRERIAEGAITAIAHAAGGPGMGRPALLAFFITGFRLEALVDCICSLACRFALFTALFLTM